MLDQFRTTGLALGLALTAITLPVHAGTLDDVKQRGTLSCGVSTGLGGFSEQDSKGQWNGFDVDFCRAVAAVIFNDPTKVSFVPLSAADRFEALKAKRIDLLSRNSSWTFEREAGLGLLFTGITYHDGMGFLVARKPQVVSALELNNTSVCVQEGTTTRANLADFFKANSMTYREVLVASPADAIKSLEKGDCDVFTADQSALYGERLKLSQPGTAVVLPDVVSKEPLGPAVRGDDVAWFNLIKWTNFALINAEDLGIATTTVDEAMKSTKPDVRRFTGTEGGFGAQLKLEPDWAIRAVRAVGNYGEIFERNVGAQSKLGIPRGLNQLWSNGGILYAPPLR
ncbi:MULTISPECIES: amino acid ABC transporter substrate-binding protein [unclassified Beijerinckia]|uniref:amino acid ABC transporter substrate-binding protein n=1 Tax=unclassified Beijerinckia TaxID=2638183 RepID=UPI00089C2E25|nr:MULTISPECIES: amino acid ABC transporter substrate-binding protein [unclassified Beijerinckia]MDH7794984.1 general L-amino acid transport system substrate-binding protein [Beijerinckia sp. GAS462]SEB82868.1 general L-amino acid transport system substrate-binding protein [Beijerinckia sp. 28-YEA-48]